MTWAAAALFLILIALYVKDKSPRHALYSVAREALKGVMLLRVHMPALERVLHGRLLQNCSRSPYRRTRKDVSHSPLLLNLPTSDGSGEATHPDVLRVLEGWGAGGWTWLMSATPYPSGDDFLENPELYVSYDGLRWFSPGGGVNPIARVPAEGWRDLKKEYHSDASLLLRDGTLYLYYRWSGVAFDKTIENRIYLVTSTDGLKWSERTLVLEEKGTRAQNRGFLSPSVLFLNGEYVMWTVERENGERFIVRRTGADGLNWSPPARTSIGADYALSEPWHLDVIQRADGDELILLLTTANNRGSDTELHLGFGDPEGHGWRMAGKLIEPGYFFERREIYRSSLVSLGGDRYALFYSALSGDRTWGVARLENVISNCS
ncbi:hypothetical protein FACS1894204_07560 [Synergistales bacterium]|nr:hypothetical protein FACS1894204_07560 [Synergistales bacterium]